METECPNCRQSMTVANAAAGQRVTCTFCGTVFAAEGKPAAASAKSSSRSEDLPVAIDLPSENKVEGWFVETADGALGPLSNEELIALARQGKIGPEMALHHSRSPKVLRAAEVPGLIQERPAAKTGGAPSEEKPEASLVHRPAHSRVLPIMLAVVGLVVVVLVILGIKSMTGNFDLTKNPEDTLNRMMQGAESMKNGDDKFVEQAIAMHKEGKSWGEIDKFMVKHEGETTYIDHPSPAVQQLYIDWRDAVKKSEK